MARPILETKERPEAISEVGEVRLDKKTFANLVCLVDHDRRQLSHRARSEGRVQGLALDTMLLPFRDQKTVS
jgi:hypothetical protein